MEEDYVDYKRNDVPASDLPYVDTTPLDIKEYGKWLKDLRDEKSLTLSALGELIGYSTPHISQIETGKKKNMPSPDYLEKLAEPLGVKFSHLLILAGYDDLAKGVRMRELKEDFGDVNFNEDTWMDEQDQLLYSMSDLHVYLNSNIQPPPRYNGHQLTDTDKQLILRLLNAVFPNYAPTE